MKKILSCFMLVFIFMLCACGNDGQSIKTQEISALEASELAADKNYEAVALEMDGITPVEMIGGITVIDGKLYNVGTHNGESALFVFDISSQTSSFIRTFGDEKAVSLSSSQGQLFLLSYTEEEENYFLTKLAVDGTEHFKAELSFENCGLAENWSPLRMCVSNEYLYLYGGEELAVFKLTDTCPFVYRSRVGYGAQLLATHYGDCYIACSDEDGYVIYQVNEEKQNYSCAYRFDRNLSLCGSEENCLYLNDNSSIYTFSTQTGTMEKLLSWSACGIFGDKLIRLSENTYLCTGAGPNVGGVYTLKQVDNEISSVPTPITLVCVDEASLPFDFRGKVQDWNNSHPECPIEIRCYAGWISDKDMDAAARDYKAAKEKIIFDINAGKIADIYYFGDSIFGYGLDASLFARKGMLEDIYPYIDRDPELSREDFVPNLLSALEINKGLYEVIPQYVLETTIACRNVPGELTYDELNTLVASEERFDTVFNADINDRYTLLSTLIASSGDKLIDWEKGQCYFDSPYFISVLNATAQIQENPEIDIFGSFDQMIAQSRSPLYVYSVDNYWMPSPGTVYGEDGYFPGLPELGSVLHAKYSFGISAYSTHKEECWEFLRQFYLPSETLAPMLSLRKDVVDGAVAYWLTRSSGQNPDFPNENVIENFPYIETTLNNFIDAIYDVQHVFRFDESVWSIVREEASLFYDGQSSAEKTAAAIQSRVSLYVAEQS